jgi:hypothetical protein
MSLAPETPRRFRPDLATPPEVALRAAMAAVQAMPSVGRDVRLNGALIHIHDALKLVGEFVDERLLATDMEKKP